MNPRYDDDYYLGPEMRSHLTRDELRNPPPRDYVEPSEAIFPSQMLRSSPSPERAQGTHQELDRGMRGDAGRMMPQHDTLNASLVRPRTHASLTHFVSPLFPPNNNIVTNSRGNPYDAPERLYSPTRSAVPVQNISPRRRSSQNSQNSQNGIAGIVFVPIDQTMLRDQRSDEEVNRLVSGDCCKEVSDEPESDADDDTSTWDDHALGASMSSTESNYSRPIQLRDAPKSDVQFPF